MTGFRWVAFPFLISIYFVLTLAASNAAALNQLRDLILPASTAVLVCGLCWATAYLLSHDVRKASLLSSLWVMAFSTFGYVAEALRPTGTLKFMGEEPALLSLFFIGAIGPSLAIVRTPRDLSSLNRYLTTVSVLLVLYTTGRLLAGLHWERDPAGLAPPPVVPGERAEPGDLPDIYVIILDKYTGSELLRRNFGFDNTDFVTHLRQRGFIVPTDARANYAQTQLALAAFLNLDYIQSLPRGVHLYDLIEHNRLAAFLKGRGYRFVFLPSAFKFTAQNRHADLQLPPPAEVRGEFGAVWQRTTMLPELFSTACALLGCKAGRLQYVPEAADFMDWKFERMQELAGGDRPTFVLAHLSLPHEPFLYNADCTYREPYWPLGGGVLGDEKADQGYLAQVSCVNRKVSVLVDSILARSRRPPIVVLQADHGHGRLGRHLPAYTRLPPEGMRERMSVFAAYLLPGVSADSIGDTITPVNAARFVLRHYFDADLPPVADASYWSTEARPLDFAPIGW